MPKKNQLPLLVAISNMIVFAVINILHQLLKTPIQYITSQDFRGYDYRDFYYASLAIVEKSSPYSIIRYVTPPLPAVLNIVFVPFGFEIARNIFTFLIPLSVLFSYLIVYLYFKDSSPHDSRWLLFSGVLLIAFSYPFYFLIARGNIDGLVLLCMVLGLLLHSKQVQLGSLLLAIAMLSKLYPLLFLAYLFFTRRWKPFLWTCGWMLVLSILTWSLWDDYFASSYHRLFFFRLDENGSIANTLMILMVFIKYFLSGTIAFDFNRSSVMLTAILYATTVVLMLYSDYKLVNRINAKEYIANALLYFPFMVAIPQLVYHYEFVVLLPLLPVLNYLWHKPSSLWQKSWLILIAAGLALSQSQAIALYTLTGNMLGQYIPGFGLLLILVGVSFYKMSGLKGSLKENMRPATLAIKHG